MNEVPAHTHNEVTPHLHRLVKLLDLELDDEGLDALWDALKTRLAGRVAAAQKREGDAAWAIEKAKQTHRDAQDATKAEAYRATVDAKHDVFFVQNRHVATTNNSSDLAGELKKATRL